MEAVKKPSSAMVWLAFATVYLVWGSTYFFIQKAIEDIPPFLLGALRFLAAGSLMLGWCLWKGEKLRSAKMIRVSLITGFLLLFIGNGAVIWAELTIPSSLAAIIVSSAPIWFVLLDYPKWKENLADRKIITGLLIGFLGVLLLFSKQIRDLVNSGQASPEIMGLLIVLAGSVSWAGGSLYSKYKGTGSALANTTWQMFTGGTVFLIMSLLNGEGKDFHYTSVSSGTWLCLLYLIVFGSLAAYSAYVWLLSVRPATQVSTYAYVNPVVAVLLGVLFANEKLAPLQLVGLGIILFSVLLINQSKR
jgi:drug/metabolite transporter (DMT)-like permease